MRAAPQAGSCLIRVSPLALPRAKGFHVHYVDKQGGHLRHDLTEAMRSGVSHAGSRGRRPGAHCRHQGAPGLEAGAWASAHAGRWPDSRAPPTSDGNACTWTLKYRCRRGVGHARHAPAGSTRGPGSAEWYRLAPGPGRPTTCRPRGSATRPSGWPGSRRGRRPAPGRPGQRAEPHAGSGRSGNRAVQPGQSEPGKDRQDMILIASACRLRAIAPWPTDLLSWSSVARAFDSDPN